MGYNLGTKLQYNSGCMSSSKGPNQGLSKAICMSYGWLIYEVQMVQDMSWRQAWTPLDVTQISYNRYPILMALAQGVDKHFWVSQIDSLQSLLSLSLSDINFSSAWRLRS